MPAWQEPSPAAADIGLLQPIPPPQSAAATPPLFLLLYIKNDRLFMEAVIFISGSGPQDKARCLNCLLHYLLELPDTMAAFIDTFFQWRKKAPKARGHPAPRFHPNRRPPQWQDLQEALQWRKYCVWRRLLRYERVW